MLDKIIDIAKQAGEVAKIGFNGKFDINFKSNSSDLVTDYDKKTEKFITDFIKKEFPNHSILAEESGETNSDSEFRWVIDPIDGTTNFAYGLPIFSVSIGVQKNGQTIYGVVNDVMMNTIYSAEFGSGAWRNDTRINVSSTSELQQSLLVTGFPYDLESHMPKISEKFTELLLKSRAVRRLGSAALDLCYIASGVFDGYWEMKLQPWDFCAGKLIVEEAGGKVTNFAGAEIGNYTSEILATNCKLHNKISEILSS
ncbi:MAG: inositol monophosphatase family protein [Melioribacteraceae bacterium]|nr:MAG: inositol monophosphatase family protein [Melioribacteraceae bacterium]